MLMETHIPFSHQTNCWCGTKELDPDNATYVLRGVGICNRRCFKKAEEEQLAKISRIAGTVCSHYLISAAILAVLMLAFTFTGGSRAWAQEHHHKFHPEYNKWMQPGGKSSCCNARFNEKGDEVGDCEATTFELRNTEKGVQWYAYVPIIKQTLPVPDDRIIREKNPDPTGTRGHICFSLTSGILCAVPPTGAL